LKAERVVETSKGQALADELGIPFFECSAKVDHRVTQAFMEVCRFSINDAHTADAINRFEVLLLTVLIIFASR
jgi:CHASE3 domain sensor protein